MQLLVLVLGVQVRRIKEPVKPDLYKNYCLLISQHKNCVQIMQQELTKEVDQLQSSKFLKLFNEGVLTT